jgi:hypothetical protein
VHVLYRSIMGGRIGGRKERFYAKQENGLPWVSCGRKLG